MLSLVYYLIVLVGVLVRVSFYTLYERKILGSGHLRKGPNIVGIWGVLQPFRDAVKLFNKEFITPLKSNQLIYFIRPILILRIRLLSWVTLPYPGIVFNFPYLILIFFILTAGGVYLYLGSGWSSNSSYSVIGRLRCVAQRISYEVRIAFLFMVSIFLYSEIDLFNYNSHQSIIWLRFLLPPVAIVWFISSLAETNRRPFDFAEGESELVSGFNLEYGSISFALLFIAEYARIIFMSVITITIFLGGLNQNLFTFFIVMFLIYLFVWVRISYPRTRYDKLIRLSWVVILPSSLLLLIFCVRIVL
jgi:NADH-ubiquinone oxidoreductase chain 1